MGVVRAFCEADIPQIADLHRRVFRVASRRTPHLDRAYQNYFRSIFLNHPCTTPGISSLVFDEGGAVAGFLGVTAYPILMYDRPAMAAVGSQLIVEPNRRSSLAGLHLLKAFLSGPQAVSVADEASDSSRKLWMRFGGRPAYVQSMWWARVLRPAQLMISQLGNRLPAKAAAAAVPTLRIADAVFSTISGMGFKKRPASGIVEQASPEELAAFLADVSRDFSVRPAYKSKLLRWVLTILARHTERGKLRACIVRADDHQAAGCYTYYARRGGLAEVLQLAAKPGCHELVLRHLFHDAWREGVAALSGRINPEFMEVLRQEACLFHHRGYWMLVHSKRAEAMRIIRCGDAFLTRLEGEYYTHFNANVFALPIFPEQPARTSAVSVRQAEFA